MSRSNDWVALYSPGRGENTACGPLWGGGKPGGCPATEKHIKKKINSATCNRGGGVKKRFSGKKESAGGNKGRSSPPPERSADGEKKEKKKRKKRCLGRV